MLLMDWTIISIERNIVYWKIPVAELAIFFVRRMGGFAADMKKILIMREIESLEFHNNFNIYISLLPYISGVRWGRMAIIYWKIYEVLVTLTRWRMQIERVCVNALVIYKSWSTPGILVQTFRRCRIN